MMSDYVLSLEGIQKSFGGVPVLKDVDFRLKRGSVHALVGGNGAGKSTLMKILTGIYSSDAGTIRINGKETKINKFNDAQKNGISIIFQELSLIPTLSVTENIFLNKELKKGIFLDKKEMHRKAQSLMKELGIDIDVEERIGNLNVGYCQLIEIAKALRKNASVLVMDEPTASLSDKETEILFKIINNLRERQVSIVYISHRMNEIFKIADEISVLCNGKIVASQPTAAYTLKSLIQYMMGNSAGKTMEWKERITPVGESSLLEVSHLKVEDILKDVSFTVRQREVVGVAGLMGSGRTELLECLFGIRKLSGGEVKLEGKTVRFRNIRQAIEYGVALVPEDRRRQGLVIQHLLKDNLIITNMKTVKRRGIISSEQVKKLSERWIRELGIKTDGINVKMLNLSGGNQQKLVIAKWLNTKPKLLLLDEPTAGVDIVAKGEIIDLVRQFVSQNRGVIFVSSELSEMMAICDRIIVLNNGTVTGVLEHCEIKSEEVLQHAIQNQ
ncbi:sugar ABC transporter ATP-binding protein [Propionispora vibrioides]|uniref:Monosaccharide ABC transporter ATP-binding protein, CUT2 family n=1 Tax=Propionispora vibrioides TaxID=112903 RepID=A0A1H8XQ48_9FIRM|nr:sugar ABC transporter ATP-binding protein [Propionispora vibrioides]SEP42029.1 monosaccharide ABC transporter ATP-binding protein, CUT2 family [Propionispora vibrioides]